MSGCLVRRLRRVLGVPLASDASRSAPALGAYGLVIHGIPGANPWMQPQLSTAPTFSLHVHADDVAADDLSEPVLTETRADFPLIGGGRLRQERHHTEAHFHLGARPPDEDLLHPYLAPAAALYWQWSGREAIHAGVFEAGGGAVLMLGDKEAGKSTTLAWLATQGGTPVLSDDLAVLDGDQVLVGPRSIDLRVEGTLPGVSEHLVRSGERHRVRLPAAPPALRLVGLVVLDWGPALDLAPVGFASRMELIARQRTFPTVPANPTALLELASVPMIRATRPRDPDGLTGFCRALVDYFS
jgi:hypothetical protein